MGIIAPILWLLWTGSVLYYSWKVAHRLRDTRLFPIAFAIVWYSFMLLFVFTYSGIAAYENFISNAYLWLLLGILFRLPDVLTAGPATVLMPAHKRIARGGFQF